MRRAGVDPVIRAEDMAVVGLVEVVRHLPRIHHLYRKLIAAAKRNRPPLAILTDSPDFHLRVAKRLKKLGIPVVYLIAPQVWAWRKGRLSVMRRVIDRLLCIFPFEEEFFRRNGVRATYIGHPLAPLIRPSLSKSDFFRKHRLPESRQLVTVLPGSRKGEAARHLPALCDAVARLYRAHGVSFVLPASPTAGSAFFKERIGNTPIHVMDGETWDAIAHADLALAASGTVTVEAALLGTPMVTFYKVARVSWLLGKFLVNVPFYSMVNIISGREIVAELMQSRMTGENIASEAGRLLSDAAARDRMRAGLAEVAEKLRPAGDPMEEAAIIIEELLKGQVVHVS